MIRALFDTNVIYSAMVYASGACAKLFEVSISGSFELVIAQSILDELMAVIERPKAQKEINKKLAQNRVDDFLEMIQLQTKSSPITQTFQVPDDPKDDHVLSAAIHHQVDYLVTGDRDLLCLKKMPELKILGIKIVTPKEFLDVLSD